MDITITLEELEKTFNSFFDKISSEETEKYSEYVSSEFKAYSDIIREFFTGKENEIKNIYSYIRNKEFPYNKIKSPDIVKSRHMYIEYLTGMTKYMVKMTELQSTDDVDKEKLCDNISKIKDRDNQFVTSIFGGDENPPIDEDLDSSMKNIEVLIDTNSDFNVFKTDITNLINKYNSSSELYKPVVSKGVMVYINSIRFYIYSCIKSILNCYMCIQNSLQHRTPVNPPKETPQYQMF